MTTLNPVYIVDGDPSVHDWATIICEEQGLACRAFGGGGEFLSAVGEREPDCVLLDMRMPQRSACRVRPRSRSGESRLPMIVMTGFGDVDVAVQSMKMGAIEFLEKPFPKDVLFEALNEGFSRIERRGCGKDEAQA